MWNEIDALFAAPLELVDFLLRTWKRQAPAIRYAYHKCIIVAALHSVLNPSSERLQHEIPRHAHVLGLMEEKCALELNEVDLWELLADKDLVKRPSGSLICAVNTVLRASASWTFCSPSNPVIHFLSIYAARCPQVRHDIVFYTNPTWAVRLDNKLTNPGQLDLWRSIRIHCEWEHWLSSNTRVATQAQSDWTPAAFVVPPELLLPDSSLAILHHELKDALPVELEAIIVHNVMGVDRGDRPEARLQPILRRLRQLEFEHKDNLSRKRCRSDSSEEFATQLSGESLM